MAGNTDAPSSLAATLSRSGAVASVKETADASLGAVEAVAVTATTGVAGSAMATSPLTTTATDASDATAAAALDDKATSVAVENLVTSPVAGSSTAADSGRATAMAATSATTTAVASNTPVILNASATAHAGDFISIQGWNFGTAPTIWLYSNGATTQLPILDKVGTGWVAVQLPSTAQGGLTVKVQNGGSFSAGVHLNAARAYHLDALQIVPGGALRVFGRNLLLSGATPTVKFDGMAGSVNVAASNEYMLVVTAPSGLRATKASVITVDNGNGTGAHRLNRSIEVVTGASGDAFGLGVGWAASLSTAAARVIDAKADSRLSAHVACNGSTDDTAAMQAAISYASSVGGGTVKLPAGTCRVANSVQLLSGVVLQGAGKTSTTLRYEVSNPVYGGQIDSAGIADMTIANAGGIPESILLHDSTRVFLKNVTFTMGKSHQIFLSNNTDLLVNGCDFVQGGVLDDQGPYVLGNSRGFVFTNNTTRIITGSSSFDKTSDGFIANNHFTRDGAYQNMGGVMHVLTMNFTARVAIVDNLFDVVNGPITNPRNDGETLLTEGGGGARTENLGYVQSATSSTLTDNNNTINTDPLGTGSIPEDYGVAIVDGKGAGQTRRIMSVSNKTITVDSPWDVLPDTTSRYATMVWGLEKSLIKGNSLTQNPRGIYLYQTAVREVDIIGNKMAENAGIYLRSYQLLSAKQFMPIYNVKVAKNTITNTNHLFPANATVVFVNSDGKAFGTANIGVELQDNQLTANIPNVSSNLYDFAGADGYVSRMNVEANYYETTSVPRVLGTMLQRNTCTNCDVAFRLGTGSNGIMMMDNPLNNTKTWWVNERTTVSAELGTDIATSR